MPLKWAIANTLARKKTKAMNISQLYDTYSNVNETTITHNLWHIIKTTTLHQILDSAPIAWLEVHPENYMGNGLASPLFIGDYWTLSLSIRVGLSLGCTKGSANNIWLLLKLIQRYQPAQISEHLAWSHKRHILQWLTPSLYGWVFSIVIKNINWAQDELGNNYWWKPFSLPRIRTRPMAWTIFKRTGASNPVRPSININNVHVSAPISQTRPYRLYRSLPTSSAIRWKFI